MTLTVLLTLECKVLVTEESYISVFSSILHLGDVYFGRKGFTVVFIVDGHQGWDEGKNHEKDHHDGIGDLGRGA